MQPTLEEVESLALKAGEIISRYFGQALQVGYKGEIDPVTEADLRSEEYLLGEIRQRYPDHLIISEESGSHPGQPCCRWYIDPLDGTVNFSHGLPIFSVSLGYAENGKPCLGAVYDPVRGELFSAQLGQGARLNGRLIHTSSQVEIIRSLLVTGFPYDIRNNPLNNLDLFGKFMLRSQGVRRLGSAALDLCYVACGRLDGFWEPVIQPWDVAAGALIASEAGAFVTRMEGGPDFLTPPCSILAANPALHQRMLDVIRAN